MMNLREYFDCQQEKSATATSQPEALGDTSTMVSVSSIVASTSGSNEQSDSSTTTLSTLPDDLPVPPVGNVGVKLDMVAKGPTQPRDCNFPRRKFSNGNLSFNPAWYDIKEAKGWLEYSEKSARMYCFACRLFESELRKRNEPNWISIGVCNWKKGLEKNKESLQKLSAQVCRKCP